MTTGCTCSTILSGVFESGGNSCLLVLSAYQSPCCEPRASKHVCAHQHRRQKATGAWSLARTLRICLSLIACMHRKRWRKPLWKRLPLQTPNPSKRPQQTPDPLRCLRAPLPAHPHQQPLSGVPLMCPQQYEEQQQQHLCSPKRQRQQHPMATQLPYRQHPRTRYARCTLCSLPRLGCLRACLRRTPQRRHQLPCPPPLLMTGAGPPRLVARSRERRLLPHGRRVLTAARRRRARASRLAATRSPLRRMHVWKRRQHQQHWQHQQRRGRGVVSWECKAQHWRLHAASVGRAAQRQGRLRLF